MYAVRSSVRKPPHSLLASRPVHMEIEMAAKEPMSRDSPHDARFEMLRIARFVMVRSLIGAAIPVLVCLPEFLLRWHAAHSGAVGEATEYGEPAFYMLVFGVLMGVAGALYGILLFPFVRHRRWPLLRLILLMLAGTLFGAWVNVVYRFFDSKQPEMIAWIYGAFAGGVSGLACELAIRWFESLFRPPVDGRLRFSLRDLLIVTTFVAAVLGLIVYTVSK